MSRDSVLEHALALSLDDRIQLIDDLLERMVDPNSCSELTPAQQLDLLQRLEADRADPGAAIPWEEAEQRIGSPR